MRSCTCFHRGSPVYSVVFGESFRKILRKDDFEQCTKRKRKLSLKRRGVTYLRFRIVSGTRTCSVSVTVRTTKKYCHSFEYCAVLFFIRFRKCVGKPSFLMLFGRFAIYCGCFHTQHVFLYKYTRVQIRRIRNKNDVYRSKRHVSPGCESHANFSKIFSVW